jgi:hypothetical protein
MEGSIEEVSALEGPNGSTPSGRAGSMAPSAGGEHKSMPRPRLPMLHPWGCDADRDKRKARGWVAASEADQLIKSPACGQCLTARWGTGFSFLEFCWRCSAVVWCWTSLLGNLLDPCCSAGFAPGSPKQAQGRERPVPIPSNTLPASRPLGYTYLLPSVFLWTSTLRARSTQSYDRGRCRVLHGVFRVIHRRLTDDS